MTVDELRETKWWLRWKTTYHEDPDDEVIELATSDKTRFYIRRDTFGDAVYPWAVFVEPEFVNTSYEFCMDFFRTKSQAINACKKMGWNFTVKEEGHA